MRQQNGSRVTGYLHDGGTLHVERFEKFMKELSKVSPRNTLRILRVYAYEVFIQTFVFAMTVALLRILSQHVLTDA